MLREVTDLLLESSGELGQLDPDGAQRFDDIMCSIVFQMEMKIRRHLSKSLASMGAAPPQLINKLANDEIEVAKPVLMESKLLSNEVLVQIAKGMSQDHLKAISTRSTLAESVTNVLVDRGNDGVLETLAGNEGAELSPKSFTTMIDRSKNSDILGQALIERQDIPPELEESLFLQVSGALKDQILSQNTNVDAGQIDQFLDEARIWMDSGHYLNDASAADKFIVRKEKLGQLHPQLLLKLVKEGRIPEFIAGLARLGGIDVDTARRVVFSDAGEKLAVICKAIGVDTITFEELSRLTDVKRIRTEQDNANLMGVYERVPIDAAQRAMRFMRTRKNIATDRSQSN